jgi:hypothetical protein
MDERTAPYNLCHSHRGRERWQRYVWWWNRWLAECTACSKKSEKSAEGSGIQGLFTLTASRHPYFHFENVHRLLYLELALVLHHQCTTDQLSRYLYCRCAHGRRDS